MPNQASDELSCFRSTKIPTWDPGRRVVAMVPSPEPMEWVVIMGIYGALFGSLGGYVLYTGFNDAVSLTTMSFIEAFVVCGLPVSMFGAMHLAGGDQSLGRVEIDWDQKDVTISRKLTTRRYPFSELSKLIVLAEYELRGTNAGSNSEVFKERVHNACILAVFGKSTVPLLASDSRTLTAELAVREVWHSAKQLANHLDVQLVEEEPRLRLHTKFLRALWSAPWWMWLGLLGLSLASTLWVSWRAGVLVI